jgi:hypothetical protein
MPLRGVKYDPIVRLQSWKFGTEANGEWWAHEGRLSRIGEVEAEMQRLYGTTYWQPVDKLRMDGGAFFDNKEAQCNRPILVGRENKPQMASLLGDDDGASSIGVSHSWRRKDLPSDSDEEVIAKTRARKFYRAFTPAGNPYFSRGGEESGFIDAVDQWAVEHASSTELLEDQLASICKWGA